MPKPTLSPATTIEITAHNSAQPQAVPRGEGAKGKGKAQILKAKDMVRLRRMEHLINPLELHH